MSLQQGHVAVAAVTWHELHYGAARLAEGKRRTGILELLDAWSAELPILDYDRPAAEWHARERARLEAKGRMLDRADGEIAATAATKRLTLVTANVRDFRHYQGLTVIDWSR
jgi:tRNA(fMet)-specific endonuclease VapC